MKASARCWLVVQVKRLIQEEDVHFLLGNTHFAFSEAKIANAAKRLTYHCCFETDELFKLVSVVTLMGKV